MELTSRVNTSAAARAPVPPSAWVRRFLPLVPRSGPVLDVAAGGGRHAELALEHGHRVVAVDVETTPLGPLAGRPDALVLRADLEAGGWPFREGAFAGVIVTNYLFRPRLDALVAALAPGGVLIYETFAAGNQRFGRPSSAAFLLRPGELLDLAHGRLQVVAYEHGEVAHPRASVVQRIAAVNDLSPAPDLGGLPAPYALPSP